MEGSRRNPEVVLISYNVGKPQYIRIHIRIPNKDPRLLKQVPTLAKSSYAYTYL